MPSAALAPGSFHGKAFDAGAFHVAALTAAGITLDGVNVRGRVRMAGLSIRDVLNDAPNTCSLTFEGDAPQIGQRLRITINEDDTVLFAGSLQTIEQSYESKPNLLAWACTAIDDTGEANARRPFGTFLDVSATTVALTLAADFAPTFSPDGIEAGLPNVTMSFDGADTMIAALARLANAIGGYTKIEDGTIYLFTSDALADVDPLDAAHKFLNSPPIRIATDSSQLRTRVYGKGYGENVPTDIAPGETLIPITDGALFTPTGGKAIAGLTPDGAQSERIAYGGVEPAGGGTLVGPGAAPGNAPALALAAGAGVTTGSHDVAVVFVTAAGKSKPGPIATINVGTLAAPTAAPVAGVPVAGTGPDQGSHDYAVAFVTAFGETTAGPISSAATTSAAVGQLAAPGPLNASSSGPHTGNAEVGGRKYRVTFVNATGETTGGTETYVETGPIGGSGGSFGVYPTTGGSLTTGKRYVYAITYVTTGGESQMYLISSHAAGLTGAENANLLDGLPTHPDGNVTGRNVYRHEESSVGSGSWIGGTFYRVANIPNTGLSYLDTMAQSSATGQPWKVQGDTTDTTGPKTIPLYAIPIGPAGTTGRKIYRNAVGNTGVFKLIATLNNNTATTHDDAMADASRGVDIPSSNTTGTAFQRVPITAIPIGPLGVTARKLFRRFNGAGTFKLVTTIANNTGTTFNDTIANSGLGAAALTVATAIGNQIAASSIPKGATAVTARELYMSAVGSGALKLAITIPDNVTTDATITTSDATLAAAAAAPINDTSGLTQPPGQINPGSTDLPVAAATTFRSGGGWVVLGGGQVARYSGISGQTLTGIPPTGSGSITTTVLYGSQALPAPMLIGVTGLTRPMLKGSAVHIWVQRDHVPAQTEHAARTGGDGVVEFLITDNRRGEPSLTERCDADLTMFARPIVTVAYATRDVKTRSGKTVAIDLASPLIVATLTIQDVTITEIDIVTGLPPRFTVNASSVRFSLEDELRRLIAAGGTQ